MQQAKKLVLLDEFDTEYKRLQRPADAVAKTGRSLQLSDTLRESWPSIENKQHCNVNCRSSSFVCRNVNAWYSLPEHVVNCKTTATFKRRLSTVDLNLTQFVNF